MTRQRTGSAASITDAEKAMRDAALGGWLSMGATDPEGDLRQLVEGRKYLDRAIRREVASRRRAGATWAAIGDALGINRSAAQQRYADLTAGRTRGR